MSFTVITNSSDNGERLVGGQFSADYINGLGGNDTIVGENGSDILVGDLGDDEIYAGSTDTDPDIVIGGDGDDRGFGGGGGDLLDGGAGSDELGGGTGNDVIFGERGVGTLDLYGLFTDTFDGAGSPGSNSPFGDVFTLINFLSQGSDTLGIDDNYLNSFSRAESGDDTGWGGSGRDALFGGWGDDMMGGGSGNDLVVGNRDDDMLFGGTGDDVILGGDENDSMYGGAGNDYLDGDMVLTTENIGDLGKDGLEFPAPADDVDAEDDGTDGTGNSDDGVVFDRGTSSLNFGNDFLDGTTEWVSNDRVQGGNDLMFGGAGDDLILGREGGDTIWGGAGNDLMLAGDDNDTDVFGFIDGHGLDTICEFNAGETPEGRNGEWEEGEDVIYLEGGVSNGEFQDAVDAGAIFIDEGANLVFIDTDYFGIDSGNAATPGVDMTGSNAAVGGGRYDIRVEFRDDDGAAKFGAANIAFDTDQPEWVDITAGFQFDAVL